MTDILQRRLTPSPHAATSQVGDETVILHLANGTYYGLDPVGTQIWTLIGNALPLPEICQRLAVEYGIDLPRFEADTRKFLADLEAHGILVDG